MSDSAIIEHQTVTAIVDNVTQALSDIDAGFALLRAAKDRLQATLGESVACRHLWDGAIYDHDLDTRGEESRKYVIRNAWRYVIKQTELRSYMTERRSKELDTQIENNELPSLTSGNIMTTLHGLSTRVNGLLNESIVEVFDWLRPTSAWGTGKLKTNHKYKVGAKAIIYGVERNYSNGFCTAYHYDQRWRALGNVFSLLDKQGVKKYPHDFVTMFNAALKEQRPGDVYSDQYFRIKPYKNGNAHIEFLRRDLLAELNRIGAGEGAGLPEK